MIITQPQFAAAWRLASRFGHLWAGVVTEWTEGLTTDMIHAAVTKRHGPEGDYGKYAPVMDERGVIVHTTLTGRLTWAVFDNGTCEIQVRRTGEVLAELYTGSEEAKRSNRISAGVRLPHRFHERHWEELQRAVTALGWSLATPRPVDLQPETVLVRLLQTPTASWSANLCASMERVAEELTLMAEPAQKRVSQFNNASYLG